MTERFSALASFVQWYNKNQLKQLQLEICRHNKQILATQLIESGKVQQLSGNLTGRCVYTNTQPIKSGGKQATVAGNGAICRRPVRGWGCSERVITRSGWLERRRRPSLSRPSRLLMADSQFGTSRMNPRSLSARCQQYSTSCCCCCRCLSLNILSHNSLPVVLPTQYTNFRC